MSKKIWSRESKLLSVICCQISRSSSLLILSVCIRSRRLNVSNSSSANSLDSVIPARAPLQCSATGEEKKMNGRRRQAGVAVPMHSAKSARARNPSQERRSKLACTSIHALLALLVLMKRSPRSALCAPERVRSSAARCRRAARAARADSMPVCGWPSARLWVRPKRLVRSCENWRAMDMASALSSCENCSSRCDEVRLIDGDRDRDEDDGGSPRAASGTLDGIPAAAAAAGSTLRSTMVSSSCRSSVTSTSSSPSSELRGEEPVLSERGVVPAEPPHRWWWEEEEEAAPPLIGPESEPAFQRGTRNSPMLRSSRVRGGGFGISGERRPRDASSEREPSRRKRKQRERAIYEEGGESTAARPAHAKQQQ
ncbi:hypothetical protein PR202_gb04856 [Eleusine coracana subsp. coracana]|uniref:Uncharacterized protein n=1 Tax=Eleusine coracana subsp. coracana TaxID=191504 RepID=A0AAV5E5J0_ELECO|nr:hypothetical protein PR202_gb04856 [Eleusine coracana subsp. coracana]